jgi:hypothetical protein
LLPHDRHVTIFNLIKSCIINHLWFNIFYSSNLTIATWHVVLEGVPVWNVTRILFIMFWSTFVLFICIAYHVGNTWSWKLPLIINILVIAIQLSSKIIKLHVQIGHNNWITWFSNQTKTNKYVRWYSYLNQTLITLTWC